MIYGKLHVLQWLEYIARLSYPEKALGSSLVSPSDNRGPAGRAGANSLNFAILIAIPAILTALSHLLLNILAHQGDSQ